MKSLLFIPLLGYIFNIYPTDSEFQITKNDTIYQYTKNKPHDCFYVECPLKGELIFYSTSKDKEEQYLEKFHFQYPALTKEMCLMILKRRDKYVNL